MKRSSYLVSEAAKKVFFSALATKKGEGVGVKAEPLQKELF